MAAGPSNHRAAAASVTTSSFLPGIHLETLEGELLGRHLLADLGAAAAASALVAPFVRYVGPCASGSVGLGGPTCGAMGARGGVKVRARNPVVHTRPSRKDLLGWVGLWGPSGGPKTRTQLETHPCTTHHNSQHTHTHP